MASSSSSAAVSVKRDEFNAFHKSDRTLFARLVLSLRRDISQSFRVMSFLLYLEKSGLVITKYLIVSLVPLPDFFINAVADEIVMCLCCLSYEDFSTFVASSRQNDSSLSIPLITRMTGGSLTLAVIHQNRESILLAMKKHLTHICYPAFEDISLRAHVMYNKEFEEREKAMEEMKQLKVSRVVHKAESSSHFLSTGTNKLVGAFYEDEQVTADDRTVFLTFSRGYPISEAEVHAYFTRRFGEIIEAIIMPGGDGNEQPLYAKMVLHSAAMIPQIVTDGIIRNKYTINGKHVWARKYIPRSTNNLAPSYGISL